MGIIPECQTQHFQLNFPNQQESLLGAVLKVFSHTNLWSGRKVLDSAKPLDKLLYKCCYIYMVKQLQ